MSTEEEILFEVTGAIGLVTLNRPKALNALTHEMCLALKEQLQEWETDENVRAVLVEGTGEKAFCAGGDIVKLYTRAGAAATIPITSTATNTSSISRSSISRSPISR